MDQRWGKSTIQILVVLALILGAVVLLGSKMLVTMAGDGEHDAPTSVEPTAVSVTLDGTKKTVQTSADTVGGLVRELGVQKESRFSAPLAAKIFSLNIPLNISTPKSVTLLVDGTRNARTTTAPDVEDFLTESDVVLGQHDALSVPESSAVIDGMSIKVSRVALDRQVRATEVIPFTTRKVSDSRLDRGEEKTVRPGKNGEVSQVFSTTVIDGETVSRELVRERAVSDPVPEVVAVGTRTADVAVMASNPGTGTPPSAGPAPARANAGPAAAARVDAGPAAAARVDVGPAAVAPDATAAREATETSEGRSGGTAAVRDMTVNEDPTPRPVVKAGTAPRPDAGKNATPAKPTAVNSAVPGPTTGKWAALAECESGGNWSINTGNGYFGGLQFSLASWRGAGGDQYSKYPHKATPAEQIATAEVLRSRGGWRHWPACSAKLGLL